MQDSHSAGKLRIGAWQAAVLFQIFGLLTFVLSAVWAYLVLYAPHSISQYLPYEYPINASGNAEVLPFVLVWGIITYFSVRGSTKALLASLVYSVLVIVILAPEYLFASVNASIYGATFSTVSLPSFGTILIFVLCAVVAGLDLVAFRDEVSRPSLVRIADRA